MSHKFSKVLFSSIIALAVASPVMAERKAEKKESEMTLSVVPNSNDIAKTYKKPLTQDQKLKVMVSRFKDKHGFKPNVDHAFEREIMRFLKMLPAGAIGDKDVYFGMKEDIRPFYEAEYKEFGQKYLDETGKKANHKGLNNALVAIDQKSTNLVRRIIEVGYKVTLDNFKDAYIAGIHLIEEKPNFTKKEIEDYVNKWEGHGHAH